MALTGLVSEVVTEGVSAAVSGAVTAGAATISVDNAAQFPAAGSITVEDISTGTPVAEDLDYVIDDVDQPNLLNLVGVSTYGYADGSIVTLTVPYIPTTTVYVTTDENQPALPAIAAQEMVVVHAVALAEGPREAGAGAPVLIEEVGGVYTVSKVLAPGALSAPALVGPIAGAALPPGVAPDGITPQDARVIVVSPFAVGAVRGDWQADTINENPVYYKVYSSLTSPVVRDSTRLVGQTSGTNFEISQADGVMIPLDVGDNPTQPVVHVVIESWDVDGLGAVSNEGSAQVLSSDAMITAHWVKALEIQAQQIIAGTITANLGLLAALYVGGYVVIDGVTSSITIYADLLHTIPLVQLRPDGSVFRGQIIASDISVLNGLILQGTQSQISASAAVTLMNGVGDPAAPPALGSVMKQIMWPAQRSGYTERGIAWDATDSCWLRLLVPTGSVSGNTIVEKISAAGAHIADRTLANVSGISEDDFNGICRVGGNYVVTTIHVGSTTVDPYIVRFSATSGSTATYVDKTAFNVLPPTASNRWITVGYDGTSVYLAVSDGAGTGISTTTVYVLNATTLAITAAYATPAIMGTYVHYVGVGSFDFGASRMVIGTGGTERVFTMTPATYPAIGTLTNDATKTWIASSIGGTLSSGGLGWDGTAFYASEGLVSTFGRFSTYYPASGELAWVSYYDNATGPTRATLDSPIASLEVRTRFWLQVTLPPSAATSSGVLMGLGSTQPADTALLQRAETLASNSMLVNPGVAGGSAHPTLRTVTNKALTSGVATLATSAAHGYAVGNEVLVTGVDATFNGQYTITAVPDTTHFSYAVSAANVTSVASAGLAEANTFGAGTPGLLQAQSGSFIVRGNSTGSWDERDDRITPTVTSISPASTTATIVAKWPIKAKWFTTGRLARILIDSQVSATSDITWKIYMGPLGTNADPLLVAFDTSPSNAGTLAHAMVDAYVRCIDASHMAAFGFVTNGVDLGDGVGPANGVTTNAAVDTTIDNFLTVEAKLGLSGNTLTINVAYMEKLRG